MIRQLDGLQGTQVAGHYNNATEARKAIQRNEIYGFLYIPYEQRLSLFLNANLKYLSIIVM